ncbi:hypothetical protein Tco_0909917 [Tanacetum coccineum]|uniref:Uncharacterized protein n=1 Tax=Tanacetum coccineum TaxID=301880 RepID=A0ABQ5CU57_9ASTR
MGLDDTYSLVRSQILTTDPLPDVKSAFATLSSVESHKSNFVHTMNKSKEPNDEKRNNGDSDGISKSSDCACVSSDTLATTTSHQYDVTYMSSERHSDNNHDGISSSGASHKDNDATISDDAYNSEG